MPRSATGWTQSDWISGDGLGESVGEIVFSMGLFNDVWFRGVAGLELAVVDNVSVATVAVAFSVDEWSIFVEHSFGIGGGERVGRLNLLSLNILINQRGGRQNVTKEI